MIKVLNLFNDAKSKGYFYIGRPCVMGNPVSLDPKYTQAQAVSVYLEILRKIAKQGLAGAFKACPPRTWAELVRVCCPRHQPNVEWEAAVWQSLQLMIARHKSGQHVELVCYCKPAACHGDAIKEAVEKLSLKI